MASKKSQVPTDSLFFSAQLSKSITKRNIYEYFSEFKAHIKRVVIFRNSAKQSLGCGCGFVTFTSVEVASNALDRCRGKSINSVPVFLKYYFKKKSISRDQPAGTEPPQARGTTVQHVDQTSWYSAPKQDQACSRKLKCYRLMVAGKTKILPETISENDMRKHFEALVDTPVHSVSLSYQPVTHKFLGFAIVEYCDRRAVIEARVKLHETKLCDKHVLYVQLESPLDHLEITTLQCSAHESVFLRHYFHDKKTYTFNNCTVDVIEKNESLKIVSSHNDLKPAEAAIRDSLLMGLLSRLITFQCDEECIALVEAHVLNNKSEFIYIVQEKKPLKGSNKFTIDVFIFGYDSSPIEETVKILKTLKPQCKTFGLHFDFHQVQKSLEQGLQLHAQKHNTVMKLVQQQCKLYGLQAIDIENAWKDIKNEVDSTAITETVTLTSIQVKYLQDSQAGCLNEIKDVAELIIRELPPVDQKLSVCQISITAELRDIAILINKLKEAASKCICECVQIVCSQKHLLPWRKRWDSLVQSQCSQKAMYIVYYVETSEEIDSCTVSFDICADNVGIVEEVKNVIVNVENGQAFTVHTITTLSQREIEYLQKNTVAVTDLLQQAHNIFLDLQIPNVRSINILIASELGPDKVEKVHSTLMKHFQKNVIHKKLKFLDSVTGAILVKEKLLEFGKCKSKIDFIYSKHKNSTIIELSGVIADVSAAEAHITEQLKKVQSNVARTDQLLLKKTSFPFLSSSMIPSLKEDQLLSCSYPTLLHQESLLAVKYIQTVSGHVVTIELCDDSFKQCHPDAVLCTRDSLSFDLSAVDSCTRLNDYVTVTYLPALVDTNVDVTAPKCEVNVSISNCPSLNNALLVGLNEIHPRNYGLIKIQSQCALRSSSKWLLSVLSSVKEYLILHPKTTIHTIQVILIPPVMPSRNEFDSYTFSTSAINYTDKVLCKASTKLRWYWEEHGGYIEYDQALSDQINSAWNRNNCGKCQLKINSQIYDIDFNSMTQKNVSTGFLRPIKNDQPSSEQQASVAVQWNYLDDTGNFSCYTLSQSEQIESMYSHKCPVTTLSINGWEYSIDFDRMVQVNVTTQRERPIKREQLKTTESSTSNNIKTLDPCDTVVVNMRGHPLSIETAKDSIIATVTSLIKSEKIPYPPSLLVEAEFFNQVEKIVADLRYVKYAIVKDKSCTHLSSSKVIEISGERELLLKAQNQIQTEILNCLSSKQLVEYPPEWELQYKSCQLFPIRRNSSEWNRIAILFETTLRNVKIVEISRVQNKILWQKYQQDKIRICEKNNGDASEKELFHGSRSVKAEDIVKGEDGLDMRYSAEGMWGRANYFAVNSSYSDSYAYKRADGKREIIVAKVLTGDSCTLPSNPNLRMPPEKPSSMNSDDLKIKYDTVNGATNGSKVYMTYSNEKAYPAYIIIYHHISVGSESLRSMSSSPMNASLAQQVPVGHKRATASNYQPNPYNPPPRPGHHNPPYTPSQHNPLPSSSKDKGSGCALM